MKTSSKVLNTNSSPRVYFWPFKDEMSVAITTDASRTNPTCLGKIPSSLRVSRQLAAAAGRPPGQER